MARAARDDIPSLAVERRARGLGRRLDHEALALHAASVEAELRAARQRIQRLERTEARLARARLALERLGARVDVALATLGEQ